MKRGIATFTLDWGKCPPWLFDRMVKLGRELTRVIIEEYGPDEYIRRLADPVWFQSLGTVLAFDWNASGLTTVLTAALKESFEGQEKDWGVFICGGKGRTSRKTPQQIETWGEHLALPESHTNNLIYNSKMTAKVDSALIQDGYQLYHHVFFFSKNGSWTVVQQGMNTTSRTARRYHWFSDNIQDLVVEPHAGIMSDKIAAAPTLNMTSAASDEGRRMSVELVQASFGSLMKDIELLRKYSSPYSQMIALKSKSTGDQLTLLNMERREFHHHPMEGEDFSKSKYLEKILHSVSEAKPKTYEELVGMEGVGPKTVRALALVSEMVHGAEVSYKDPARYSFAHGGKDGTPYLVDRKTYDQTIETLRSVVSKSKIDPSDKYKALGRLDGR